MGNWGYANNISYFSGGRHEDTIRAISYHGEDETVAIPEDIDEVPVSVLKGHDEIKHLIVPVIIRKGRQNSGPPLFSDCASLPSIETISVHILSDIYFQLNLDTGETTTWGKRFGNLVQSCPNLKTINIKGFKSGSFSGVLGAHSTYDPKTGNTTSSPVAEPAQQIRVNFTNVNSISCSGDLRDAAHSKLVIHIDPAITFGALDDNAKMHLLWSAFIDKPGCYTAEEKKWMQKWVKSSESAIKKVYKRKGLLLAIVSADDMSFPLSKYRYMMELCGDSDIELKATIMQMRDKYHDIQRVNQREQEHAIEEIMDPTGKRAMKKLYAWSEIPGTGGIQISAYKGDDKDVIIPDSIDGKPVIRIGEKAFHCKKIESVVVPETVTEIGMMAFCDCNMLESITIKGPIRDIPKECFLSCRHLEHIELPDTIEYIGEEAFFSCKSLGAFKFPKSLKMIGRDAFHYAKFTSVSIENVALSVSSFYSAEFDSVTIKHVPYIPDRCFEGVRANKIRVEDCLEIGGKAITGRVDALELDGVQNIASDSIDAWKAITAVNVPRQVITRSKILKQATV